METAAIIREWMKGVLAEKVWSARQWALLANINPSTVARAIKDDYEHVTSTKTLVKLASAAGVSPPLTGGDASALSAPVEMPIRHIVAAGAWHQVDEYRDEIYGRAEVFPVAEFQYAPQWLERVAGESMNRLFPPNTLVHVVEAAAIGYAPRHGDCVIVERRRSGGAFVERSIKQVELTPKGVCLWPRSYDPKWSEPLDYRNGIQEAEDAEVAVVGLVIRGYMDPRPPS